MRWSVMAAGLAVALSGPTTGRAVADGDDALRALERETLALVDRVKAGVVGLAPKTGGRISVITGLAGGTGTGVVLTSQGDRHEILTSTDVIGSQVVKARVVTGDGRELEAAVVGRDPAVGAVLLRCAKSPGRPLPLGRSGPVRVGQRVLSAGSPFGSLHRVYQVAISMGSITGRYTVKVHEPRRGPADRYKGPVLETDAGVNPGSFGGPICDRRGRVLGLVVSSLSRLRWLGTAAPIDAIRQRLPALRAGLGLKPTGLVSVADSGVLLAPAVDEPGIVVLASAKSPLRVGDVITARNGVAPGTPKALATALALRASGATRLTVRRDGRTTQVEWKHAAPAGPTEDF